MRSKGRLSGSSSLVEILDSLVVTSDSYSHNLFPICPQILLLYILNIHNLATQHLHYQSGDFGSSLHLSLTVSLKQTPNRFPASTFTTAYFQQNSLSDPFIKARLNNAIPLLQNPAKALHDWPLPYLLTSSPTALSLIHSALTILAILPFHIYSSLSPALKFLHWLLP